MNKFSFMPPPHFLSPGHAVGNKLSKLEVFCIFSTMRGERISQVIPFWVYKIIRAG